MQIKKNAIAKCSLGIYGLITVDEMKEVTYADGNKGVSWTGLVIRDKIIAGINGHEGKTIHVKEGDLWSSKNPVVVTYLHFLEDKEGKDLIEFARNKINAMGL